MSIADLDNYNYFTIMFGEGDEAVDIGRMTDGITRIDRGVGNSWSNEYTAGLGRYGRSWVRGYLNPKTITVEFIKDGDQRELTRFRRELAAALDCPDGPKRLTFNDTPNAYYMAVVDGSVSLTEDIATMRATGTITFIVPDGLLYSSIYNVLNEHSDESLGTVVQNGDHVEVTINNQSSVEVYPTISIRNRSENGWIGIVNQNGVMEIGTKELAKEDISNSTPMATNYIRTGKGDKASWSVFTKAPSNIIAAPHSSHINVQNGTVAYGDTDVSYTTSTLEKRYTPVVTSSAVSTNVGKTSQTYMGTPEAKGFAAKLVVSVKSSNPSTNTSVVHADLYLVNVRRANTFTMWDINYTVRIGDQHINHSSRPNMAPQYGGKYEALVMSNDYTVKHAADGTASFSVLGAINGRNQAAYVPGYFQVGGTFTIPSIKPKPVSTTPTYTNVYKTANQTVSGMKLTPGARSTSGFKWDGGMVMCKFPNGANGQPIGAKSFRCDFNIKFYQNTPGQTGNLTVGFIDKNGNAICAYEISKDDQSGEEAYANFYVGRDDIVQRVRFGANNGGDTRSLPNVAFNMNGGSASVIKDGSRITFIYGDKPYTFNVSKIEHRECVGVYISVASLNAATGARKSMYVMSVESLSFTNNQGQRTDTVYNRYREESKITVDLKAGEIYVNNDLHSPDLGQKAQSDLVHGSRFFSIPRGTSVLKIYPSAWCTTLPDVQVEWQDMWL